MVKVTYIRSTFPKVALLYSIWFLVSQTKFFFNDFVFALPVTSYKSFFLSFSTSLGTLQDILVCLNNVWLLLNTASINLCVHVYTLVTEVVFCFLWQSQSHHPLFQIFGLLAFFQKSKHWNQTIWFTPVTLLKQWYAATLLTTVYFD